MSEYFLQIKRILKHGIESRPVSVIDKNKINTIKDLIDSENGIDTSANWWPSCSKARMSRNKFQVHLNAINPKNDYYENTVIIKQEYEDTTVFENQSFSNLYGLLGNNLLIVAGHYMPDIRDLNLFPREPFKALLGSVQFIKNLQKASIDYLILLNDLSLGSCAGFSEINREALINNYQIPEELYNELMQLRRHRVNRCFFINERKLFLKLNRERKQLMNEGRLVEVKQMNGSKFIINSPQGQDVIISNVTDDLDKGYYRCVGAVNRLVKLAEDLGYSGIVHFYPYCSIDTVSTGIKQSRLLYNVKIPVLSVFLSFTCFKNVVSSNK